MFRGRQEKGLAEVLLPFLFDGMRPFFDQVESKNVSEEVRKQRSFYDRQMLLTVILPSLLCWKSYIKSNLS